MNSISTTAITALRYPSGPSSTSKARAGGDPPTRHKAQSTSPTPLLQERACPRIGQNNGIAGKPAPTEQRTQKHKPQTRTSPVGSTCGSGALAAKRTIKHQQSSRRGRPSNKAQSTKHKPHTAFAGAGLPANRAEQRHRRQASSHRAKNTKAQATNPNPNRSCRSGAPPRCGPSSNTYAGNTPNSLPGHPVFDLETGNPLKLTLIIGHKNPAG